MILAACLRVGRAEGKETVTDKALGNRFAIRAENLSAENIRQPPAASTEPNMTKATSTTQTSSPAAIWYS